MVKNLHASLRIEKELYEPLQKEANDKYEGNMSLLIRLILKDYVKKQFNSKTAV
jgi:hypothetical protein